MNELEINPVYWLADNVQTKEDANDRYDLNLTDEQFAHIQSMFRQWEILKNKTLEEAEQLADELNEEAEQRRIKFDEAAKLRAAAIAKQETDAEGFEDPDDYEGEYEFNFDEALEKEYVMFNEVFFKATYVPVGLRNFVVIYNENKYGDLELYDAEDDNSDIDFDSSTDDFISWEIDLEDVKEHHRIADSPWQSEGF